MIKRSATPGPWTVRGRTVIAPAGAPGSGYHQVVADCSKTVNPSDADANAPLIAAAPELLEALRIARPLVADLGTKLVLNPEMSAMVYNQLQKIDLAIAKASSG